MVIPPQWKHCSARLAPQCVQNFRPEGFSVPQAQCTIVRDFLPVALSVLVDSIGYSWEIGRLGSRWVLSWFRRIWDNLGILGLGWIWNGFHGKHFDD